MGVINIIMCIELTGQRLGGKMEIDNFMKPVYTEAEAYRIAETAAEKVAQKLLQAMHLDSGIA